ncbi:MAG TPA: DUF3302 domain-containing protein [Candidatus Eisenbacteria bacterium]|nr:DUF3302 domain-containing protein [Candidatus Eisenbacteria bacterium]
MLGFRLDAWDYLTFLALALVGIGFLVFVVWLAGLPGRIAIARNHPDAEAVNMMGWAGFLAAVPWIQAFIWAFKPTDIIDIRRFPTEEREAVAETIARLRGERDPGSKVASVKRDLQETEQQPPPPKPHR